MSDILICNAVPVYKTAPVATDILKNSMVDVLEAMAKKDKSKNYILINQEDQTIIDALKNKGLNFPKLDLEILPVDASFSYVYTNESAAARLIEGDCPVPRTKGTSGSLIGVETLMDKADKEVYISGCLSDTGKRTFPKKVNLQSIVDSCKIEGELKGIYLGYPMGLFVGANDLNQEVDLLTDEIRIYNEKDCMLTKLKDVVTEFTNETCGRCVFGFEGVTQIDLFIKDVMNKKGHPGDFEKLKGLAQKMLVNTVCEIDGVLANAYISALESFGEEIKDHITKKACKAMECEKFVTYHVLVSKCVGCTDCVDVCEDDAIMSKAKFVHVIDQGECTQCGKCLKACAYDAIVTAGAQKPKTPPKPIPCRAKK